jgi:Rieske Fe-S protein
MDNFSEQPHLSGRRKFLTIVAGVLSTFIIGDRALASKKPPAKKVVKKPVKKAPVKKAPVKPAAKSTPTPSATPSASATPPSATVSAPPAEAKALTVAGQNLTTANLSIGSTTAATFPKNGVTTSVLVTRVDEKTFVALKPLCTHAGGPVELSGGSLVCVWHFSRFNQRTGAVINGPASDPLPKEKVELYGDTVYFIP